MTLIWTFIRGCFDYYGYIFCLQMCYILCMNQRHPFMHSCFYQIFDQNHTKIYFFALFEKSVFGTLTLTFKS